MILVIVLAGGCGRADDLDAVQGSRLGVATPQERHPPSSPPLFAVRVPWRVDFDETFPEGAGIVRQLTEEEIATVVEDLRAEEPDAARAELFGDRRGSHWLCILDSHFLERLRERGVDVHPVPASWDVRRFTVPRPIDPDDADHGPPSTPPSETPEGDEFGVSRHALSMPPPTGVPGPSCSSTPTNGWFCPYTATTSATRGLTCTTSLSQQLLNGETAYPAIVVGGILRDYYRVVTVGSTAGATPGGLPYARTVYGVRVGRAPDASVPTVRQVLFLGGQHGNEIESVEMARRLIFWFAGQYQAGNAQVRALLNEQSILIVPAINADGYEWTHASTSWRPNMQLCTSPQNGIDPNRNFPFTWGIDDVGSSPLCSQSTYRGTSAGQANETPNVRNLIATTGYRTAVAVNIHTRAGQIILPGGYSPGAITASSPCTDVSNCTNPDLGLFYRLAGTERSPILRHPNATSVPYVTDQSQRALYSQNGTLDQDLEFGALPLTGGLTTPNLLAMTVELSSPCVGIEERTAPATLTQQELDLRQLAIRQLTYLPSLVGGTANAFELPILQRRNISPSPAAEPLTLRVAVRNGIAGATISNIAPVAGSSFADSVRPGAYYTEYGWRPTSGSVWPSRSFVCATGQSCRIATLDAPTSVATINLCDATRFTPGSAWNWAGGDCSWTLAQPNVIDSTAMLTSTPRDLTHMSESRLVLSHWRGGAPLGPGFVGFDVEVSSNGFVGCSFNNYGNCRIVRRVGQLSDQRFNPNAYYLTIVADASDFDGQNNVRMRIRVWSNDASTCGNGTCDAGEVIGACADCPPGSVQRPRLRLYDPVFVGWYQ